MGYVHLLHKIKMHAWIKEKIHVLRLTQQNEVAKKEPVRQQQQQTFRTETLFKMFYTLILYIYIY